jgi:hypothetical protein
MAGAESATWDEVMPGYRTRWQERHVEGGRRWEDVEPAYRYAWELARTPGIEYSRSWADAAPAFRRGWALRHPEVAWDAVADLMRDVWDDVTGDGRTSLEGDHG